MLQTIIVLDILFIIMYHIVVQSLFIHQLDSIVNVLADIMASQWLCHCTSDTKSHYRKSRFVWVPRC